MLENIPATPCLFVTGNIQCKTFLEAIMACKQSPCLYLIMQFVTLIAGAINSINVNNHDQ